MRFTDYSDTYNWICTGADGDKPVDVFHIIPTSWYGKNGETLSSINDPAYRESATFNVNFQASVFEPLANIYAPHYRQLEPYYFLRLEPNERMYMLSQEPKHDIFAALDYYFEHYNNGKPFILSGHSQGSSLLLHVLSEYMQEHPDRLCRMIAAYVIGYPVTRQFLNENPHLSFAQKADDHGVIISYNTQSADLCSINPLLLPGTLAINPISWSHSGETVPASASLGSRIKGRDLMHFADARLDNEKGCVICSTADSRRLRCELFAEGIYHIHDYGLYYYDLRANAALRTAEYIKKGGK